MRDITHINKDIKKSIEDKSIEDFRLLVIELSKLSGVDKYRDTIYSLLCSTSMHDCDFSEALAEKINEEAMCIEAIDMLNDIIENYSTENIDDNIEFIVKNIGNYAKDAALRCLSGNLYPPIPTRDLGIEQYNEARELSSGYRINLANRIMNLDEGDMEKGLGVSIYREAISSPGQAIISAPDKSIKSLIKFIEKNSSAGDSIQEEMCRAIGLKSTSDGLSFSEIPFVSDGKLENPELFLSLSSVDGFDSIIPVSVDNNDDPLSLFGADNVFGSIESLPEGLLEQSEYNPLGSIVFSKRIIEDPSIYSILDKKTLSGLEIPFNKKIFAVSASALVDFSVGTVNLVRLKKADSVSNSFWINPKKEISVMAIDLMSSFDSAGFLKILTGSSENGKSMRKYIASGGDMTQVIDHSLSVLMGMNDKKPTRINIVSHLVKIKKSLGVQPINCVFDIESSRDVSEIIEAGINFTKSFHPNPVIPQSLIKSFDIASLVELSEMGFYFKTSDEPGDMAEALRLASRRKKQPVYASYLRRYPLKDLIDIAKTASEFSVLQDTFPEGVSDMIDLMPRINRRKVISDDLSL